MDQEEFPTGVVTFLFTDLENSTHLWEEYPAEMKSALARHNAIIASNGNAGNGKIVKTTGDGFHAVFRSPTDAVQTVVSAQKTILSIDWSRIGRLGVADSGFSSYNQINRRPADSRCVAP